MDEKLVRKVDVIPHDSNWREIFVAESKRVADALGNNAIAIHHIGSTAIPGIYAKPIIDLLAEVWDILKVGERRSAMESLGYAAMGEFGISGRRYFRKENQNGCRTHHLHDFEASSKQIERHLAFRDYMIAHPIDAQKYSALKRELAKKYPQSIDQYMDGKGGFIKEIVIKAAQWRTKR